MHYQPCKELAKSIDDFIKLVNNWLNVMHFRQNLYTKTYGSNLEQLKEILHRVKEITQTIRFIGKLSFKKVILYLNIIKLSNEKL